MQDIIQSANEYIGYFNRQYNESLQQVPDDPSMPTLEDLTDETDRLKGKVSGSQDRDYLRWLRNDLLDLKCKVE